MLQKDTEHWSGKVKESQEFLGSGKLDALKSMVNLFIDLIVIISNSDENRKISDLVCMERDPTHRNLYL